MDDFQQYQRILVKFGIISSPVEEGINRKNRRKVLFIFFLICLAQVRTTLCMSSLLSKEPQFIRQLTGDFWSQSALHIGHLINALNFVLYTGYLLDRWTFYWQEEKQQLRVLQAFTSESRDNILMKMNQKDREKMLKMIKIVTLVIPKSFYVCYWSACIPSTVYSFFYANYLTQDLIFLITSSVGFIIFTIGLTHGLVTIFLMQGITIISVEFAILGASSVRRKIGDLLVMAKNKNQDASFDRKVNQMIKKYFSLATEIRKQNITIGKLLRNSVISLCPGIGICFLCYVVKDSVLKYLVLTGVTQFAIAMTISLMLVGRVHSAIASLHPMLCALQGSVRIPTITKFKINRIIKEVGSSKIPCFTLGNGNAFTMSTTAEFVVATVSFCLLVLDLMI